MNHKSKQIFYEPLLHIPRYFMSHFLGHSAIFMSHTHIQGVAGKNRQF